MSQAAAGAVTSTQFFALAAGLDVAEHLEIPATGLRERLLTGLRRLPADAWLRFRVPALRPRLAVHWKPLLTAAAVAGLAYLALASTYLTFTQKARERELAGLGDQVEELLVAQRDVDRMLSEQKGLAALLAERRHTYRIWQVVSGGVEQGGHAAWRRTEGHDADLARQRQGGHRRARRRGRGARLSRTRSSRRRCARATPDLEEFTLTLTMQPEADRG